MLAIHFAAGLERGAMDALAQWEDLEEDAAGSRYRSN